MADTTLQLAQSGPAVRTVTGWSIFFLVLLRISIGWHFFYEGVWKLMQDDWQATGYLVQSAGPLRPFYRWMVKDVDGLEGLTVEGTRAKVQARYRQLARHYGLEGEVREAVEKFRDLRLGAAEQDPAFAGYLASASAQLLSSVTAEVREALGEGTLPEADLVAGVQAVLAQRVPGFQAAPGGEPDVGLAAMVAGVLDDRAHVDRFTGHAAAFARRIAEFKAGYVESIYADPDFQAQLADYRTIINDVVAAERALGTMDYNKERLTDLYGRKARARAALEMRAYKPVKDLEAEVLARLQAAFLNARSQGRLEEADRIQARQLAKGLPYPPGPTEFIDWANMLALTAVGAGLMLGLFTRLSALGAIGLLALYYTCMPPLPWLPDYPAQEGHYLFVNKNLIEAIALMVIATSRVGRWCGLDAFVSRWLDPIIARCCSCRTCCGG